MAFGRNRFTGGVVFRKSVPATARIDSACHPEPIHFAIIMKSRIDLIFSRKLRRLGNHGVQNRGVWLCVQNRAAIDKLIASAGGRFRLFCKCQCLDGGTIEKSPTVEKQYEGWR